MKTEYTNALSGLGKRTRPPPISWLMSLTLSHPKLISLAAGFTDPDTLPVEGAHGLLSGILNVAREGRSALQYGSTPGLPLLRTLTASRLCALDGLASRTQAIDLERMVITNGSQQLLYMVSEALCDPGDIVLVEDPTYFVYLGILQSHGIRARGIRCESDGLNLEHLEQVLSELKRSGELRKLKLLYLVSYFQNPTGRTTSLQKKAGALKLLKSFEGAAGHPLYLLEDAAYRELRFSGEDVKSSLVLPGAVGRVIYAGTYSKPFATGTRVGFGIVPKAVLDPVLNIKGNHDFGTSSLLQHLLASALRSGVYERHLKRLRARYAAKAEATLKAAKAHLPTEAHCEVPAGGLYVWVRLPTSVKAGTKSRLFKAALANEVLYVPGELCYAEDASRPKPNHEMRVSFGSASISQLRTGIRRLGVAMQATGLH